MSEKEFDSLFFNPENYETEIEEIVQEQDEEYNKYKTQLEEYLPQEIENVKTEINQSKEKISNFKKVLREDLPWIEKSKKALSDLEEQYNTALIDSAKHQFMKIQNRANEKLDNVQELFHDPKKTTKLIDELASTLPFVDSSHTSSQGGYTPPPSLSPSGSLLMIMRFPHLCCSIAEKVKNWCEKIRNECESFQSSMVVLRRVHLRAASVASDSNAESISMIQHQNGKRNEEKEEFDPYFIWEQFKDHLIPSCGNLYCLYRIWLNSKKILNYFSNEENNSNDNFNNNNNMV
eukprot:gb/GECH01009208.1/.p1 GENE.gb/GECH01009208.1/~~gb/GECH01009208.1/.p1  ORF type:complete len:291 (+),score=102.83 gb/GECH01009208.1/:1-873(+)